MVIMCEIANLLDSLCGSAESIEDRLDVGSVLHGDDSQLILLINPDKEGFGIVVENTSSSWPVSVDSAGLEESVALPI